MKKEINLPKGWKILVEESKGLPDNVFCVLTDKNETLYVKVASQEDILRHGALFEVLTLQELKKLGIEVQESYSVKSETYIEESSEEEVWNPSEESLEEFKERIGAKRKVGKLNAEDVEILREKYEEEKAEKEELRTKLTLIAEKEFERKKRELGAPEDIETVEQLKGWARAKGKSDEDLEAERLAEPVGHGSGGQASLDQASGVSNKEYDSVESMIDDLRAKSQSSEDAQTRREAQAVLNELFAKSSRGFLEQDKGKTVYIDKSKTPLKEQLNRKLREKALKKRKAEEEG